MTRLSHDLILKQFSAVNCWNKGDQRAPHKPLLLLLELARVEHGLDRLTTYEEIDNGLKPLLREFGPKRDSIHTEYPFWHLQNDYQFVPIWEVENAQLCEIRTGGSSAKKSDLLKYEIKGGFTERLFNELKFSEGLRKDLVSLLLNQILPSSLHQEVLNALGMEHEEVLRVSIEKRKRSPHFRKDVLKAYKQCCAICRSSIRLGDVTIGLEAAHIKWHQANGPERVNNGLALCAMHHRLFDFGAFALRRIRGETVLLLSDESSGSGLDYWLLPFKDQAINTPHNKKDIPKEDFLEWHRSEVFKGKPASELLSR